MVVYEPTYVEREPEIEVSSEFNIQRFDDTWVITGKWLENLILDINFDDYEARNYFVLLLRRSGLFTRLEEMGIADGDTVDIYDFEFEYQR